MQLPVRVLEYVLPAYVDSHVLASHAFVGALQLLAEIAAFDVKIEDAGVVDEDGERALGEVHGGLAQDLVQHVAMGFWVVRQKINTIKILAREVLIPTMRAD